MLSAVRSYGRSQTIANRASPKRLYWKPLAWSARRTTAVNSPRQRHATLGTPMTAGDPRRQSYFLFLLYCLKTISKQLVSCTRSRDLSLQCWWNVNRKRRRPIIGSVLILQACRYGRMSRSRAARFWLIQSVTSAQHLTTTVQHPSSCSSSLNCLQRRR